MILHPQPLIPETALSPGLAGGEELFILCLVFAGWPMCMSEFSLEM